MMTISVIITNWKRQKCIPSIIEQLNSQKYPKDKYEVIIVDDNTPDKDEVYSIVKALVHKYGDIKFRFFETHRNVTLNPALRYNIGARHASNDIILLNESDVLMQGEYLQKVSENHEKDPNLFLGPELIHVDRFGKTRVCVERGPCDLGGSIRKKHYFAVRGFDERTMGWGGIESDFAERLKLIGVHYRKDPTLIALHRAVELCGIKLEDFSKDMAKPASHYKGWPPFVGATPNPKTWGTLDTLEEIKF
jgi:glycosyltransferase involved in cell wall biosynthesis